jgi:hypothetical protein
MSSLQKLFTGPANSIGCNSCGKPVSIAWKHALWTMIPVVILLFLIRLFEFGTLAILITGIIGGSIASAAYLKLVPLKKTQIKEGL